MKKAQSIGDMNIGPLSEIMVVGKLLSLGYEVFRPIGAYPIDLVCRVNGNGFIKLQIKTVRTRQRWTPIKKTIRSHRKCRPYDKSDIDYFLAVDGNDFYIIPYDYVTSKTEVILSRDYFNRWDLLPPPFAPERFEVISDSPGVTGEATC